MKSLFGVAAVVLAAGALNTASASASGGWHIVASKYVRGNGAVASFNVTVRHPTKVELYLEGVHVRGATTIVCVKGSAISALSRTFGRAGTRNMLWHVPGKGFDSCYLTVAVGVRSGDGRATVQVQTS
jgi:hypothetical protein